MSWTLRRERKLRAAQQAADHAMQRADAAERREEIARRQLRESINQSNRTWSALAKVPGALEAVRKEMAA